MKKTVHKLVLGEVAPCGVDFNDHFKREGIEIFRFIPTAYHWRNVTCRRCLKTRKKKK